MTGTTIGQRIRSARTKKRLTQPQVATAIGASDGIISQWENDKYEPKREKLDKLAKVLGVTANHLLGNEPYPGNVNPLKVVGIKSEDIHKSASIPTLVSSNLSGNVTEFTHSASQIPLIPWTKVGEWMETLNAKVSEAMQDAVFAHSKKAFCVRNQDESMSPDYRPGEIIQIEPEREPKNGNDVVAELPSGKMVFKRLQVSPDGYYLAALNPDWPERISKAPDAMRIIGVVVGSWIKRD